MAMRNEGRLDHSTFLKSPPVNAHLVRHSGRTLFDHLSGTADLLNYWDNSPELCTAGFFHSIYGTRHFRHQCWPISDRETIRLLIGERAEMLVHAFCTIDRPS